MASLRDAILISIAVSVEFLLKANHHYLLWFVVVATACFYSFTAAFVAMFSALLSWIASMSRRKPRVRYRGPLDVMLGRTYRASTVTPGLLANNNVSIAAFGGDMVIAYRKAETHFASPSARIIVAKSKNLEDWTVVWEYSTGKDDLREVLLWEFKDKLYLYFACLAPFKKGFSPRGMHWTVTPNLKVWSDTVAIGRDKEITWDIKVRQESSGPVAYKVGYIGNHYAADAIVNVVFEKSTDGENWQPVGKDLIVYTGGVSEVSFEFTPAGDLVAIGRNEDGDETGFGSQLFFARRDDLGSWVHLKKSLPNRFDSPRMISMEGEIVLFARYAESPYAALPEWLPFGWQRLVNLIVYSAKPKAAAVYRLVLPTEEGVWQDDPVEVVRFFEDSFGDTGFFSVAKFPNCEEWAVANYSSTCHSHASWVYGQLFETDVYVCRCLPIRR